MAERFEAALSVPALASGSGVPGSNDTRRRLGLWTTAPAAGVPQERCRALTGLRRREQGRGQVTLTTAFIALPCFVTLPRISAFPRDELRPLLRVLRAHMLLLLAQLGA
jgi:hypothetical protein